VEAGIAVDLADVSDAARLHAEGGERGPSPVAPEGPGGCGDGVEAPLMARREGVPHARGGDGRQPPARRWLSMPPPHRPISPARAWLSRPARGAAALAVPRRSVSLPPEECRDVEVVGHRVEAVRAHAVRARPPPRRRPISATICLEIDGPP